MTRFHPTFRRTSRAMTLAELLVGIVIITILAGVGAFAGDAVIKSSKAGAANAAGVQFIEQYTALSQTGSTQQAAVLEAVNAVGGPATALAALPTVSTKVGQLNVSVNSAAAPTTVAIGVNGWCTQVATPAGGSASRTAAVRTAVLDGGVCAQGDPTPGGGTAPPAGSKTAATAFMARGGGTGSDLPQNAAVAADGTTLVAGSFTGTTRWGASTFTSAGSAGGFLAKTSPDPTQTWQWVAVFAGAGWDSVLKVQPLPDGGVVAWVVCGTGCTSGGVAVPAGYSVVWLSSSGAVTRVLAAPAVWPSTFQSYPDGRAVAVFGVAANASYTFGTTTVTAGAAKTVGTVVVNADGTWGAVQLLQAAGSGVTAATLWGTPQGATGLTVNGSATAGGVTVTNGGGAAYNPGLLFWDANGTMTVRQPYTVTGTGSARFAVPVPDGSGDYWYLGSTPYVPVMAGWQGGGAAPSSAPSTANFVARYNPATNTTKAYVVSPFAWTLLPDPDGSVTLAGHRTSAAALDLGNGVSLPAAAPSGAGSSAAQLYVVRLGGDLAWKWAGALRGDAASDYLDMWAAAKLNDGTYAVAGALSGTVVFSDGMPITTNGGYDVLLTRFIPPAG